MNKIYILIFFVFTLISCKEEVKRISIPSTKVSIEAPENFKLSKSIVGLEKGNNAMIQISDLVGGNFDSNSRDFSRKSFEDKGVKVFDYKEFELDGYRAKYIHMQGQDNQEGMSIVFGDSTFCDMVMALFPANDKTIADQIKKALFSIKYDKNLKIDYLDLAVFKVNPNKSKFKFAQASGNMFTFSTDGVVKKSYENEPMFLIVPLPADYSVTKKQLSESILNGLTQNGFVLIEEKNIKTERVNGYDAYEIEAYGFLKGKKALVYLLIIRNIDKALALEGVAYSDFDNELIHFKEIAHNVVFK
ncbi:hypothetical protein [Flavobacterium hydatis]|uniref:Lipoprotein n=1 Tax=Flavobacterium hydatis TaxID=991 RepID=A0A086AAR3_FLAHY|nr:hypothetical protein [Flavobacterium hydatis]KFF13777.1 hypothetical protein IW20_17005 [Flavobacterium hydatis]OXA92452.1 hypothetical protein B0A62_15615 [Flavobacterium hydatis]